MSLYDSLVHTETNNSRHKQDHLDEENMYDTLISFRLYSKSQEVLQNIATKHLATTSIQDDLLCAAHTAETVKNLLRNGFWKRHSNSEAFCQNTSHRIRDQQADIRITNVNPES